MLNVIDFRAARKQFLSDEMREPTLTELLPDWLEDRTSDGRRPCGIETYRDVFGRFIVFAGDIPVSQVTTELIASYKRDLMKRVGAGTARLALTVVRSFCEWSVTQGYLDKNHALRVKHPKVEPSDPDPLTREQLQQLLGMLAEPPRYYKALWRRTRRAIFLMLYTGVRLAECSGLEWRDIDLERKIITIRRDIAKGGNPRIIPICAELLAELQVAYEGTPKPKPHWAVVDQGDTKQGRGKPLSPKSLAHIFERWLSARGLQIHAHQLRKTFATELYIRDVDIMTIQRLLGHTDPKTTIRYIGAWPHKEHEAVAKLTFQANNEA
jgi:integrase